MMKYKNLTWRLVSFLLAAVMVVSLLPGWIVSAAAEAAIGERPVSDFTGKTVSILSHSMSTYAGVSNNTAYNSTIGNNDVYYTAGRHGVYREDTWWQQAIDALNMELCVNNSWSGSCIFQPRKGAASVGYGDRAVNLHNDHTGEEPDIIWVYLGCNDFAYYKDTFGKAADVDYSALIRDNDDGTVTYAAPTTACEAYAIMLHKVETRYPDAEIYCMTSTARRDPDYPDNYADTGQPTEYVAELHEVAEYFGFPVIDLEDCIPKEAEVFDKYIGDKRAHANALGMDQITNELLSVMLGRDAEIRHVTSEGGAVAEQAVLLGGSYRTEVEVPEGYSVSVTMGGTDISEEAYADGVIIIEEVTGDIEITLERGAKNFRWELRNDEFVSVTENGFSENNLTLLEGSITDGIFSGVKYALEDNIFLSHDKPWVMEWACTGNWDATLFAKSATSGVKDAEFIFRSGTEYQLLAIGAHDGEQYNNYGIPTKDLSIDMTQRHVYRLENRGSDDGNMVWLSIDGVEIGPMNRHYIGSKNDTGNTSDWISGRDLTFGYMGTVVRAINYCALEYVEVWEGGEPLAGKTVSILGDSISTLGGVSNNTDYNSTIGGNAVYYGGGSDMTRADTWWQQTVDALNMELLVNNSWSGSCILHTRAGTVGAYVDRCVQLHNDHTGEEPDVIAVFMGTNDYSYYQGKLGTADIDYDALITDNGDGTFTYATPATSCEAYAVMLHKMTHRYPDAEIYCMTMLPRRDPDYDGKDVVPAPTAFNAELTKIITRFGCTVVDLEHCGITPEPANFDTYIGDKRVHPNKAGMDKMTEGLVGTMLGREVELYTVTTKLTNAELKGGRVVISGGAYTAEVAPTGGFEGLTVAVSMGGEDITSSCYSDGVITISSVTGDITVTASALVREPKNFRWELDGSGLVSSGEDENALTLKGGSVSDGLLMNAYYAMGTSVILSHDRPWVVEFKVSGNWSGMVLSASSSSSTDGNIYLFKTTGSNGFMGFGERGGSQFNNYGIALEPCGVDTTAEHIYRVENRISIDGNNMAYLLVDGVDYGAMDNYFVGGSTDKGVDVDWINGRDLVFSYIGASSHAMNNCELDYLQVWEAGKPSLAGKTLSILGASISTYAGTSNGTAADTTNSTIRNNAKYYPHSVVNDVTLTDTWWMQVCSDLGLRLLVNNSWSGSSLLHERSGTVGAYVDRCVQLHDNTGDNAGETPDIIGIQMGTNDFQYYKETLGTADIDYAALITENADGTYTYAEPVTSLEAAAIVLHKISVRYPDAEVYYLNISQRVDGTDELIRSFNAELKQVVEHFGAHIVDIYGSAITMDEFDTYIGDGRVHPNKLGMDAYTEAFKRTLITNTAYAVDTHTVTFDLDGVTANYGDNKIVADGDSFAVELTAAGGNTLSVTVTMDGKDITDSCYADGTVAIGAVTADVTIIADSACEPKDYRWEFDGTDLVSVSGGNALTKTAGTTTDGVFNKTRYALETSIVLLHDQSWSVEWKCEGTFQNSGSSTGARIFTSTDVNAEYDARYIFKSNKNGIIAMGEKTTTGSHNYGVALGDHGIDWVAPHTYRLENRIAADGSNMVYLLVDGAEIGPMTHYYIGTADQHTTSDWLSGKDFVFPYMGTDTHGFTNCSIEYIAVWEAGHTHDYAVVVTAPTCTERGYTTYTCSCGESYVGDYTDFTGHSFGSWAAVDEDTRRKTCGVCGEEETIYRLSLPMSYGGFAYVEENPNGVYYGTHNVADVLGLKSGTYTNGEVTVTVEGTRISVSGTPTSTLYFDLQTGQFGTPDYKRDTGYSLPDGDYRFGLCGSGTQLPTICIRYPDGKGNLMSASQNSPVVSAFDVSGADFGVPYLYFPKNTTYEFDGQLVLTMGSATVYDSEASSVEKITGTGEFIVDGFLWTANEKTAIFGYPQSAENKDCKLIYTSGSKEYIDIFLPQPEGYLQTRMNLANSTSTNAYGWRLEMMYACDDELNQLFPVTSSGEYEAAIKLTGRPDFMGMGAHGSEQMTDFTILVDGAEASLEQLKTLTEWMDITITRSSDFYDPADEATIVAEHTVEYRFDRAGLTVAQDVEWLLDETCAISYMMMFPVRREYKNLQITDTYFDDFDTSEYDVSQSGFSTYPARWTAGASKMTLYSKKSGVTATLESLVSSQLTGTGYKKCSPSASYNKLYFTICGGGSTQQEVKAGDVWHTEARYEVVIEKGTDVHDPCIFGHNYAAVTTPPTCTEQGYTTYTCTLCGDSYVADYVEASGHDFSAGLCTTCGHDSVEITEDNGTITVTCDDLEPDTLIWLVSYDGKGKFVAMKRVTLGEALTLPAGEKWQLMFVDSSWTPLRTYLEF